MIREWNLLIENVFRFPVKHWPNARRKYSNEIHWPIGQICQRLNWPSELISCRAKQINWQKKRAIGGKSVGIIDTPGEHFDD